MPSKQQLYIASAVMVVITLVTIITKILPRVKDYVTTTSEEVQLANKEQELNTKEQKIQEQQAALAKSRPTINGRVYRDHERRPTFTGNFDFHMHGLYEARAKRIVTDDVSYPLEIFIGLNDRFGSDYRLSEITSNAPYGNTLVYEIECDRMDLSRMQQRTFVKSFEKGIPIGDHNGGITIVPFEKIQLDFQEVGKARKIVVTISVGKYYHPYNSLEIPIQNPKLNVRDDGLELYFEPANINLLKDYQTYAIQKRDEKIEQIKKDQQKYTQSVSKLIDAQYRQGSVVTTSRTTQVGPVQSTYPPFKEIGRVKKGSEYEGGYELVDVTNGDHSFCYIETIYDSNIHDFVSQPKTKCIMYYCYRLGDKIAVGIALGDNETWDGYQENAQHFIFKDNAGKKQYIKRGIPEISHIRNVAFNNPGQRYIAFIPRTRI